MYMYVSCMTVIELWMSVAWTVCSQGVMVRPECVIQVQTESTQTANIRG